MKFGLYYSQAQDWVHPGGGKAGFEEGGGWDEAHKGDFDAYLSSIAVPQVKEILTRYHPDILWWDTPRWMNQERAKPLLAQLKSAPGIIHNNRLGGDYRGDTETPEQRIPATGFKDRDWEVCMTINDTWGFKSYDENWKAAKDLLQKLCDIASKGGNFLLNVGPTAEGLIPQPSIERLERIGAWMDTNGQAIYGTTAGPFHRLPWGRCTRKQTADGVTLYLLVFDWPGDGKLWVPGLMSQPRPIQLLSEGGSLKAELTQGDESGLLIEVPGQAPDPCVSVIKLEFSSEPELVPNIPRQTGEGIRCLTPHFADLHTPGSASA
ncbi:MAG: hypothetical protein HC901_04740 [Bdellovibrionaceae bacterium]|nr:hypothetical protein [Pseudobdellovibrionaceae bacterium]